MVLKNLLQTVVHRRRNKSAARHSSITRLLLPTCITIILSMACFMTASWGWFTANQSCGVSTISAGYLKGTSATVTTKIVTNTVTTYAIRSTVPAEAPVVDTGEASAVLLHNDSAPSGGTAEPASESESAVPKSSSETEITYEKTDLTLNEENEWVFNATAKQNHHFLVNTEGTAKGFVQVTIEDAAYVEHLVTLLMGDKVAPRKEYITEHANFNRVDSFEDKIG